MAVALETARCIRCGRELRNPVGIVQGMGPICAGRHIYEDAGLSLEEKAERLRHLMEEARAAGESISTLAKLQKQLDLVQEETERRTAEADEMFIPPTGEPQKNQPRPPADRRRARAFEDISFVDKVFLKTFAAKLPGYEPREPQLKLARIIAQGLNDGQHVVAEAGTGTGKSFAYLVPAVEWATKTGKPVVISTGTIALQEQLMQKDIPFLQRVLDRPFNAVLVKGKGNYLCKSRYNEEAEVQGLVKDPEFLRVAEWAKGSETGDKAEIPFEPMPAVWNAVNATDECTGRKCPNYEGCFLFQAKRAAKDADILVCNHHVFFSNLKVRLMTGGAASILPEHGAVVFDEAHHVEEIATEAFGVEVVNSRIPFLLREVRRLNMPGLDPTEMLKLDGLNQELFGWFTLPGVRPEGADKWILKESPDHVVGDVVAGLSGLADKLAQVEFSDGDKTEKARRLADRARQIARDFQAILAGKEEAVSWIEVADRDGGRARVVLHQTLVSVAEDLRESIFEALHSVVMVSATIATAASFDYLKRQVGLDEALELIAESPFDYPNQCLLYVPRGLPDPNDKTGRFQAAIIPVIRDILQKSKGRAFVLFTSYSAMRVIYDQLASEFRQAGYTVLRQGDRPRSQLVEEFKRDVHSILFATASFWEGVDVQGEALSCVIIDKLPFAVPTEPVVQAKVRAIERAGRNPFMEFTVPQAVIKLKQGFGRLIRTQSDKGLVAILDNRLRTKPYGAKFLKSLPPAREIWSLDGVEQFLS